MNKLKKILIPITFLLFFSNCGYTPIFSKKDVNFTIKEIKFLGDRQIEAKISRALSSYINKSGKEKIVSLAIINLKSINVASKNSKGEAQTKRINVDTNVKIILSENNIIEKNFIKSSIYSVTDSNSEQELIEKKLVENFSSEIALQIVFEILKNTK